ncbi:TetR family transcriptional regulator [Paenibacillus cellulosilyticus]|uniref:TetR family transcriptional regulator n=1 Tax=Paenibacillus cellulosilyticus TaxID=375489 RepID=A0A2V2Z0J3_9BACL|nr:TetR/AcrR family transcriptional regulator [Paenibacillus cellulosilyticus]PWW08788.1 TetR family transcriptional regulator [Paenibacillus cellulosilyticus]QKS48341.1 TetR/AcrR family transcriptional regulator [Paenibacillus cellulosilyticus]
MNESRKVKYTRRVIKESFLQLLLEKSIGKITIAEICQLADIHRGTFYQHYHDVYQLLESIENELFEKFKEMQLMQENSISSDASAAITLINNERDTCRAILGKFGDTKFLKRILDLYRQSSYNKYGKNGVKEEDFHFIYTYFTSGCIGVISSWVESGYQEQPEKIMRYIERLSQLGVSGFINKQI